MHGRHRIRKNVDPPISTNRWVTATITFLTLNFVLTLLMFLKRIYELLNAELAKPEPVADFRRTGAR